MLGLNLGLNRRSGGGGNAAFTRVDVTDDRFYLIDRPDDVDGAPLILVLSGGGGVLGAEDMIGITGFQNYSEASNFVTVYIEPKNAPWNDGRTESSGGDDDLAFIDEVITDIGGSPSAIYAVGVSSGGMMVQYALIDDATRFDGIAAVAANKPADIAGSAPTGVSFIHVMDPDDPIMPYDGGEIDSPTGGTVLSASATVSYWEGGAGNTVAEYRDDINHTWGNTSTTEAILRFFDILGDTVPAAPHASDFTLADSPSSGGDNLSLDVTRLNWNGGATITGFEYRLRTGLLWGAAQTLANGANTGAREITVLAETETDVQIRAVNALGDGDWSEAKTETPTASEEETVALPRVPEDEWFVYPTGRSGEVYLTMGTMDADAATVRYRTKALDATGDADEIVDDTIGLPTGSWSSFTDASGVTGTEKLNIGIEEFAIELEVVRNDGTVSPRTYIRFVGGKLRDPYDGGTIQIPAATDWGIPNPVIWGTDNAAGEGKQILPATATSISSGDASNHFEVATIDGINYLRPTSTGVGAWSATDTYTLTMNDGTVVNVRIDADTVAISAVDNTDTWANLAEYTDWADRNRGATDFDCKSDPTMHGKTVILRPGFYNFARPATENATLAALYPGWPSQAENYLREGRWLAHSGTAPLTKFTCSDTSVKPMVAGMFALFNSTSGHTYNFEIDGWDIFRPYWVLDDSVVSLGGDPALDFHGNNGAASNVANCSMVVHNCHLRGEQFPSRYGHRSYTGSNNRPFGTSMLVPIDMEIDVHDNVVYDCSYGIQPVGCSGVVEGNKVTRVHFDSANLQLRTGLTNSVTYRNNLHSNCSGDSNTGHPDTIHIWTFDTGNQSPGTMSPTIQGNVWIEWHHDRTRPGQIGNLDQTHTVTGGTVTLDPDDYWNLRAGLVDVQGDATITVTPPTSNRGLHFKLMDAYATVTVSVAGLGQITLVPFEMVGVYDNGGTLEWVYGENQQQGGPIYSNVSVDWLDATISHNIAWNVFAPSGFTILGNTQEANSPAASDIRVFDNITGAPTLDYPADDINGDGVLDARDNMINYAPAVNIYEGLNGSGTNSGDVVTDFTYIRNYHPGVPTVANADWALAEWMENPVTGEYGEQGDYSARNTRLNRHFTGPTYRAVSNVLDLIELLRPASDSPVRCLGAANTDAGTWNFATGALNALPALSVTHTLPAAGGVVPLDGTISIALDYPINLTGSGTVELARNADGASIAGTVVKSGNILHFTPDADFTDTDEITVIITGDAVTNAVDGSAFAGLAQGDIVFTADADASINYLPITHVTGIPLWELADGREFGKFATIDFMKQDGTEVVYFDHNNYPPSLTRTFPSGTGAFQVDFPKNNGTARVSFRTIGMTSDIHFRDLRINTDTGSLDGQNGSTANVGVNFWITDKMDYWRVVAQADFSGADQSSRAQIFYETTSDDVPMMRPSIFDGTASDFPWVPVKPVPYTASAPPAVSPDDYSGLELWLDASDASTLTTSGAGPTVFSVDTWDDKSAEAHSLDGTGHAPLTGSTTINGLATVSTTGDSSGFMDGLSLTGGAGWLFVVMKTNSADNQFILINTVFTMRSGNASDAYVGITETAVYVDGGTALADNQMGTIYSAAADQSPHIVAINVSAGMDTEFVGLWSGSGFYNKPSAIGEVLWYNDTRTTAEVNEIAGYLADKWGITWTDIS